MKYKVFVDQGIYLMKEQEFNKFIEDEKLPVFYTERSQFAIYQGKIIQLSTSLK